jgi:hypothetical protein
MHIYSVTTLYFFISENLYIELGTIESCFETAVTSVKTLPDISELWIVQWIFSFRKLAEWILEDGSIMFRRKVGKNLHYYAVSCHELPQSEFLCVTALIIWYLQRCVCVCI